MMELPSRRKRPQRRITNGLKEDLKMVGGTEEEEEVVRDRVSWRQKIPGGEPKREQLKEKRTARWLGATLIKHFWTSRPNQVAFLHKEHLT